MNNSYSLSLSDKLIAFFSALFFLHGSSFIAFHTPAILWAAVVFILFIALYIEVVKYIRPLLYLLPFVFIYIATALFKATDLGSFSGVARIASSILQVCILPLLSLFLIKKNNQKLLFFVFFSFLIVEITTGVSTIIANGIDPYLVRMDYGAIRDEDPALYAFRMNLNVGDYHMAYGYAAMIPIVILVIKWRESFSHPVLLGLSGIALLFLMLYVLYISQYTIAFVAGFSLLLLLVLRKKMSVNYYIFTLIAGCVVLLVLRFAIPQFLHSIADSLDSEIMSVRLEDLASSIDGNANRIDYESDYYLRMKSYGRSIESIKEYTIIGAWNDSASGGHSFIFDNIARMGLVGLLSIIVLLYSVLKRHILVFSSFPWIYYYYYALLVIIVFYFFNPDGMYEQILFSYPISGMILSRAFKHNNR